MKKIITVICMILLLGGCSKSAPAVFEDACWGMSMKEVKATRQEGDIVDGPSENVLNYIQASDTKLFPGRTVTVAYVFTDDKLTGITVQLFTGENETAEAAMKDTEEALTAQYGAKTEEDDRLIWQTEQSKIELTPLSGSKTSYIVLFSPLEK